MYQNKKSSPLVHKCYVYGKGIFIDSKFFRSNYSKLQKLFVLSIVQSFEGLEGFDSM